MNKVFTYLEIIGIITFFKNIEPEQLNELPLKIRWNLKRNLDTLKDKAKGFEEFRNTQATELESKWSKEEFATEIEEPEVKKDGTPVVDYSGKPIMKTKWELKEEYRDEYQKELSDINEKLLEIANESCEIDIITMDIDKYVENLPEDSKINFDTIDMLTFMDEITNVANVDG